MKKLTIILLLFISLGASAQAKKPDSVHLDISLAWLQIIYQSVDNAHIDHQEAKQILEYFSKQYQMQATAKVDSTGAKK